MAKVKDESKSNCFHQTVELHLDYGSEVLRRVLKTKLQSKNISLMDHLSTPGVHSVVSQSYRKGHLHQNQWALLFPGKKQEPNLSELDITLLTYLLVHTKLSLTNNETKAIKDLRNKRNEISHVPKAELRDKTNFNTTRQLLLDVSKRILGQKAADEIMENIDSILTRKEFVSCRRNLELVKIRNEELMVKLVDRPINETDDPSDTTYLRFSLTKWTKQFTRDIELDMLLGSLKDKGIITQADKSAIEMEYNKEEQACTLIMKMVDEKDENLREFCSCLRKVNRNLADLIENRNTDGAEIELTLKLQEKEKIREIIKTHYKEDKTGSVPCEEVHIVVEDRLEHVVDYTVVEDVVLEEFRSKGIKTGDYRFQGIVSHDTEDIKKVRTSFYKNAAGECIEEEEEGLSEMSCDTLAEYACKRLELIKPNGQLYGTKLKNAINLECVTPKLFMSMTREDIKNCFCDYLGGIPFGILKELEEFQQELKKKRTRYNSGQVDHLRKFDSISEMKQYSKGQIRPAGGNLMVPAHEFRTLPASGECTTPYIVKECIKFIAACVNSRKNGTIHFGVKGTGNGCGSIIGIERVSDNVSASLDTEIMKGIETCFDPDHISGIKRCIRPFQFVPVENGSLVLEMDVIPFSGYLNMDFFRVQFPPKGKQDPTLFVYNNETQCEIMTVPPSRQDEVMKLYEANIKERLSLEAKCKRMPKDNETLARKLVTALTDGYDYVTDQFTPIICVGKVTDCEKEGIIKEFFDVPEAFLSSVAVFDFDSSVRLRKNIEKQDMVFRVTTANEKNLDESLLAGSERIWMYCNGNTDLQIDEMEFKDWFRNRFSTVKEAIRFCKDKTPEQRAIVIFFAFGNSGFKDPMLEVAEECIKCEFRNQCVVVAESEETVKDLKKKLMDVLPSDELPRYFHTGMTWDEISHTVRTVFRTCTQYDDKLPCSNGHYILMTSEEKRQLNFTDIEILSGEQCKREEMSDDDEKRRNRKLTEQEKFYKGRDVSWWNFHYTDQVGKRDLHAKYVQSAERKLESNGGKLIETEFIRHQPGAGGSTAGRFVLWHLSQFEHQGSEKTYRCCVIKQVTDNTGKEIYSFLSFKDVSPKPVVILADNISEDNLRELKSQLDEQAYKYVEANKLFCLLIIVLRVSVSYKEKQGERILKHELSNTEQSWFETKYKELENTMQIDVKTLISFNVMRKNFDPKYIQELADNILRGVTDTEKDVLKCLSLVNTYDRENIIPISTFDCLMLPAGQLPGQLNIWELKDKGPVGLVVSMIGSRNKTNARNIWNVDMTDELALLIKKGSDGAIQSGVTIISQALAEAILGNIMRKEDLALEDIVKFVLGIVKNHVRQRNPMSKHFVKIINGLFKTRQMLTEKGDIKNKFSDMIMVLKQQRKNEEELVANNRVIDVMSQCFDITSDAMVGQQLSRFFTYMKDFEQAETVILRSLKLQPNSSYLLDTHGQIYRWKMETLINRKGADISDEDVAQIIQSAITAIGKFVEGEHCARKSMETDMNLNCFLMEVKTVLILLENFEKFACYGDRNNLLAFLNKSDFDIDSSTFRNVAKQCPLEEIKKGNKTQEHIGVSLRMLEERDYQVKRRFHIVYTSANEKLLLKLRERFECFYGSDEERSKFQFHYGLGLKSLMQADSSKKDCIQLQKRVEEARAKLKFCDRKASKKVDKRDLLVLIGYEIIQMTKQKPEHIPMNVEEYEVLLRYSEQLLEIEQDMSRPYTEAYLYYALLHWPSPSRLETELLRRGHLCKPTKYVNMLKDWKKTFESNFEVKSFAEHRKNIPKNYFVLGKGGLGCDMVDLEDIRKKWKKLKLETENRTKPPVKADNFWKEDFVVERLQRFTGILDDSGKTILYEATYDLWEYKLSIRTYYPHQFLSNRRVTFVLGFTWADLAAFDVEEEAEGPAKNVISSYVQTLVPGLAIDHESNVGLENTVPKYQADVRKSAASTVDKKIFERKLKSTYETAKEYNEILAIDDMSYLEEHHHGYIADTEPFKYDFDEPVDDSFGAVGGVDIPTGVSSMNVTLTESDADLDLETDCKTAEGLQWKPTTISQQPNKQGRNKSQERGDRPAFDLINLVQSGVDVPVHPSNKLTPEEMALSAVSRQSHESNLHLPATSASIPALTTIITEAELISKHEGPACKSNSGLKDSDRTVAKKKRKRKPAKTNNSRAPRKDIKPV